MVSHPLGSWGRSKTPQSRRLPAPPKLPTAPPSSPPKLLQPAPPSTSGLPQESPRPSDYAAVSTAPSFRFRLERVRALRQHKELLAREELARAISARSSSEDRLRRV